MHFDGGDVVHGYGGGRPYSSSGLIGARGYTQGGRTNHINPTLAQAGRDLARCSRDQGRCSIRNGSRLTGRWLRRDDSTVPRNLEVAHSACRRCCHVGRSGG